MHSVLPRSNGKPLGINGDGELDNCLEKSLLSNIIIFWFSCHDLTSQSFRELRTEGAGVRSRCLGEWNYLQMKEEIRKHPMSHETFLRQHLPHCSASRLFSTYLAIFIHGNIFVGRSVQDLEDAIDDRFKLTLFKILVLFDLQHQFNVA